MDEAFVLCRILHYGTAMLLFGASTFAQILAPPRLALVLTRSTVRLTQAAASLLILSTVGWLLLETARMAEGWPDLVNPATIGTVLFSTEFGRVWQLHTLFVASLMAGIALGRPIASWAASGLVLASLGLIGHAAMQSGPLGWLHRANLATHLLSGGFWVGGLIPLIPTVRMVKNSDLRSEALVALRRYSAIGHCAVATVIATGIINTLLILGIRRFDLFSAYQVLLAAKAILVLTMTALALVNRYTLVPNLRKPRVSRRLVQNSLAELALSAAVIALVSLFGLLEPQS